VQQKLAAVVAACCGFGCYSPEDFKPKSGRLHWVRPRMMSLCATTSLVEHRDSAGSDMLDKRPSLETCSKQPPLETVFTGRMEHSLQGWGLWLTSLSDRVYDTWVTCPIRKQGNLSDSAAAATPYLTHTHTTVPALQDCQLAATPCHSPTELGHSMPCVCVKPMRSPGLCCC